MDIPADHPVLVALIDSDCSLCQASNATLEEVVAANSKVGLRSVTLDLWDEPESVVELEALTHPTYVLFTGGQERVRLTAHITKRQLLRGILPQLYRDADVALEQLRAQLDNPGEVFKPRRRGLWTEMKGGKVAMLQRVELFSDLTRRQLGQVARCADETSALAGQTLASEGAFGDTFYLLTAGRASVEKAGKRIATIEAGGFFGEMALLDNEHRSATVTVEEDSELLVIHRRDFDRLLDEIPGLARQILTEVSRRLREARQEAP